MFEIGQWVVDGNGAFGYIESAESHNRYVVVFPEFGKAFKRFATELKPAPIETPYNDYNIHFLQTLAVNTNDRDWFNELSNRLGVK